ncbi:hypothetical protein ACC699_38480, partial [Rhizobium ruizarguesonis]
EALPACGVRCHTFRMKSVWAQKFWQHGCVSTPEFAVSGEHLHFLAAILAICSDQSNGERPVHDQEIPTSSY